MSSTREVEAVVEGFIEELADIALLPEGDDDRNQTWDLEDTELEENLRRVLIENQGRVSSELLYQPSDRNAGTQSPGALPLALMTREKILEELQGILNRARNIEPTERARTEDIIRQAAVRYVSLCDVQVISSSSLGPYTLLYLVFTSIRLCTPRPLGHFHQLHKIWKRVPGRKRENCSRLQIQLKKTSKALLRGTVTQSVWTLLLKNG